MCVNSEAFLKAKYTRYTQIQCFVVGTASRSGVAGAVKFIKTTRLF